jgi:hypothetical protein
MVAAELASLAGWLRVTAAAISFPGGVEQLSHAEALATGERLHLESVHIPRPLYFRDLVATLLFLVLRQIKDAIGGCGVGRYERNQRLTNPYQSLHATRTQHGEFVLRSRLLAAISSG